MSHAEICPVCGGTGTIRKGLHPNTTGTPYTTVCHGCGGTGWVTIRD